MRTRIKFCGITRSDDARRGVELGVDAIGFVFTRASQRFIGISQARSIRAELPPFVTAVALFMDDERALDRGSPIAACSRTCCSSTVPKRMDSRRVSRGLTSRPCRWDR